MSSEQGRLLDSGKKLGSIASLINVIMPIIAIVAAIGVIIALFVSIPAASGGSAASIAFWMLLLFVGIGLSVVISFVAEILLLVAMHRLSSYYSEPAIFKNVLYAFIIYIINGAIAIAIFFAIILSALGSLASSGIRTAQDTPAPTLPPSFTTSGLFSLSLIGVWVVLLVLGIFAAVFIYRGFSKLGDKSGVHNFNTAALLVVIGLIIPLVSWIGWIFAYMGFRSLKPGQPQQAQPYYSGPAYYGPSAPTQTLPPTAGQVKYCSYCGAANDLNALYCRSCGKLLPQLQQQQP